jgi:hypothetical protein
MPPLENYAQTQLRPDGSTPIMRIKQRACELAANNAARLRMAATRKGGEAGLALACATIDMILARETDPVSWPIEELILLLESGSPSRDRQVDRLLEDLRRLHADIDELDLVGGMTLRRRNSGPPERNFCPGGTGAA